MKKRPSKEALDKFVKTLVPYIIEMIKEDKIKKTPQ
jgi:hypothetical protein